MKESITRKIENIMMGNKGKVFSINDFYNFGTNNTIKSILYRLNQENKIAKLIDGLYTVPKYSEILKDYCYPDSSEVAEKLASKFSWSIAPTGETALNYIGLSTQISNEYVYISDGPYREYLYRNKKIIFKHTTNRNITTYSKELSIMIQAIKTLGKENIGLKEIKRLSIFSKSIKENLKEDVSKLPFWIQEVLKNIYNFNHE